MTDFAAKPHLIRKSDGTIVAQYRVSSMKAAQSLMPVSSWPSGYSSSGGSWVTIVQEGFAGAWQTNQLTVRTTADLLAYPPIYACISLIAGDIAKLRMRLTKRTEDDIWLESAVSPTSPFLLPLRRPNDYQTPYQFWTAWMISRLIWGNVYILKVRDNRGLGVGQGNVRQMHVLDPCLVKPLVAEDTGEVFYELRRDYLAGLEDASVTLPASEVMHDRELPLWHPLVGVPPLVAASLSGTQGVNIQTQSAKFFGNMARPSGILVSPRGITKDQATKLKEQWEEGFSGDAMGKTAVLGNDMKYIPLDRPADESLATEQWKVTALGSAMAFHVPPYKLGLQSDLKFSNMAQMDTDYYKQCLQRHMESIEQTLDAGLELPPGVRSEFDTAGLFRMDPLARAEAKGAAIKASYMAPNEARKDEDMPPVEGGDEPLAQQQNYPLSVLAERPPPTDNAPTPPAAEPPAPEKANVYQLAKRFRSGLDKAAAA